MSNIALSPWLASNSVRKYPLDDKASGVDTNGALLPSDIVTDLSISVDGYGDGEALWLSGILIDNYLVTVTISSGDSVVLIGSYLRERISYYTLYTLQPLNSAATGLVSFGPGIHTQGNLRLRFTPESGLLHHRAATFTGTTAVKSLRADDSDVSATGHVLVEGISGVNTSVSPGILHISLDDAAKKELSDAIGCEREPIHTINGVNPDSSGVIEIRFQ